MRLCVLDLYPFCLHNACTRLERAGALMMPRYMRALVNTLFVAGRPLMFILMFIFPPVGNHSMLQDVLAFLNILVDANAFICDNFLLYVRCALHVLAAYVYIPRPSLNP